MQRGLDAAQFAVQRQACQRIERAEWFVHQQDRRIHHQGAGDADALLLAAGDFGGPAIGEVLRQAGQREQFGDALIDAIGGPAFDPCEEADVFGHRHVREERDVLEDEAGVPPQKDGIPFVRGASFDGDAAGGGERETIDQPQRRGFSRAAAADEREDFAGVDGERHVPKDGPSVAVRETDAIERDRIHTAS